MPSRRPPPHTLVVETISTGHEAHARQTKRRWYAESGVPHDWMLDPTVKTLEGLRLAGGVYERSGYGEGDATIRLPPFDDLDIPLTKVWGPTGGR